MIKCSTDNPCGVMKRSTQHRDRTLWTVIYFFSWAIITIILIRVIISHLRAFAHMVPSAVDVIPIWKTPTYASKPQLPVPLSFCQAVFLNT